MNRYELDAVVIGGGIAGLFTLAKLINNGYQAVLLDNYALGGTQTLKSQGIIHGGTKYALLGKPTEAQKQITGMPKYWRNCLNGQGDINLSDCLVLSDKQCMWALPNLSSRVTGFFAGKMMKSRVDILSDEARPIALQHEGCHGRFYALDEPVLDVLSLVKSFALQYGQFILTDCEIILENNCVNAKCHGEQWQFSAQKIFVTAGQGNSAFAEQQLRPLRMVYARVPAAFGHLYVHILEASDKPRLTISSYSSENTDELIWYFGGNVAEKGANLSAEETIQLVKKELADIFPWLDVSDCSFDSFIVNRAEGLADGKRPDTPIIVDEGIKTVAWPTKLALAPMLADRLLTRLSEPLPNKHSLPKFPKVRVGNYHWDLN